MIRSSRLTSLLWCAFPTIGLGAANVLAADCLTPLYDTTLALGGVDSDEAVSIALGADGSIVLGGVFREDVDFDPSSGEDTHSWNGSGDAFVTKFNPDGTYAWTWAVGGELWENTCGVAVNSDGSVFAVGAFTGTVDFDSTDGVDEHTSNGSSDMFVTKLMANGAYAWTLTIGGDLTDDLQSVAVAPNGDVVITGAFDGWVDFDPSEEGQDFFSSDSGSDDVFVTRFTSDGDYQWTVTFGGEENDVAEKIITIQDGNLVTVGIFSSPVVDFDPSGGVDEHLSNGNTDVFITKLGPDGSYVWTRTLGGVGFDGAVGGAVDGTGNVLVAGFFDVGSAVDFDPTDGVDERFSHGEGDIFVTKLTADGSYTWTWTAGGKDTDVAMTVVLDAEGRLFAAGNFGDFNTEGEYAIDFDQMGAGDVHASSGQEDAFVTMLLADGSYGWTRTFGGPAVDFARSVVVGAEGAILVTGGFSETVDFDPEGGGDIHTSNGALDVFLTTFICTDELPCDGDANGDGLVNPLDSGFVLARFGCDVGTGDPDCDIADMNADGLVNPLDVGYILARFGTCE